MELMTSAELAARWRRPVRWVREQAHAGRIPATKVGGLWRHDPVAVEAFEARNSTRDPMSLTPLSAARQQGKQ